MTSWARELWKHDYIHQLSLKLGINENEWLKNLPMTGENKVHKTALLLLIHGSFIPMVALWFATICKDLFSVRYSTRANALSKQGWQLSAARFQ
jgi:hypothetical protein